MAYGFSDSLVSNLFAQAGKTRVPSIVFACDTLPELGSESILSEAPRENIVDVYPRQIDLDNVAKLAKFEATKVVANMLELTHALHERLNELK